MKALRYHWSLVRYSLLNIFLSIPFGIRDKRAISDGFIFWGGLVGNLIAMQSWKLALFFLIH